MVPFFFSKDLHGGSPIARPTKKSQVFGFVPSPQGLRINMIHFEGITAPTVGALSSVPVPDPFYFSRTKRRIGNPLIQGNFGPSRAFSQGLFFYGAPTLSLSLKDTHQRITELSDHFNNTLLKNSEMKKNKRKSCQELF